MLIKLIGIVMFIYVSKMIFDNKYKEMSEYFENLLGLKYMMRMLSSELKYSVNTLDVIFMNIRGGIKSHLYLYDMLEYFARFIEKEEDSNFRFEEIWEKDMTYLMDTLKIEGNLKMGISSLGNVLGYIDKEVQLKGIENIEHHLLDYIKEVENKNHIKIELLKRLKIALYILIVVIGI